MKTENIAINTILLSLLSNAALVIIKLVAGIFGHSYALVADAIESLTDMVSEVLVLFGLKYANKPADDNHPYGHGKIEPLITFVVVAFLVSAAGMITYQSIVNIRTPHETPAGWTLWVLGGIIVWKEIGYRWVSHRSELTHSTSLKAAAWHHRSDALTSVAAFVGICVALWMGEGYEAADDWAALVAAVIILYNAYLIFRPALGEVMDEHFYDELIDEVRHHSLSVDGVIATEKCFVRKSGMRYYIDLHAIVNGDISVRAGHQISHDLKDHLLAKIPTIADVLIHIEPEENE
ncbi:cation diffusion facilitator family transporter [Ostreibacterium oceani]|uniref:Cation diffusion facilitator family transporter n=1 Tax=Ostreibacterium oceani TaxID=2654998 RepID=A0A6N7EVC8_9GAMM|nr:cation diffusion facilitator family transporter [Ostreibacterium oceani]MPV86724.1 cation diffusion facilitator family transporter [Ostreibacterium oceani]